MSLRKDKGIMARDNGLTVACEEGDAMKTGLVTILGVVLATKSFRATIDPTRSAVSGCASLRAYISQIL